MAGRIISLEHYGASAAAATLFEEFGFTPEAVVAAAKDSIAAAKEFGGSYPVATARARQYAEGGTGAIGPADTHEAND